MKSVTRNLDRSLNSTQHVNEIQTTEQVLWNCPTVFNLKESDYIEIIHNIFIFYILMFILAIDLFRIIRHL